MPISLPASLVITGTIIDTSGAPQQGFKLRGKLLSVDGAAIAPLLDSPAKPTEVTTGTDGSFSFSIKDSDAIKQILTQGYAVLFKSAVDDSTDTLDVGLSRSTPLHLSAYQATRVVLEWQPKRTGDATKPALSAKLRVARVFRDERLMEPTLRVRGQVVGPQQKPVGGLNLQLVLMVPGTSQLLAFPQPDRFDCVTTTQEDGTFQLALERGGDLLPYQPYLAYSLSFRASQSATALRSDAAVVATTGPCHVTPSERTEFRLIWDDSGAAPVLKTEKALRDGHPCNPSVGIVQSIGLITDVAGQPLAAHRVQVQAGTPLRPVGEFRTTASGHVRLPHPWPLSKAPQELTLTYQLRVLDPQGNELAAAVPLTRDGVSDSALVVKITPPAETDTSPTLDALVAELKAKLDGKTKAALAKEGIKSLLDIMKKGGVRALKDVEKADDATLTQFEQATDLWSLLPATVPASEAVKALAVWIGKGLAGSAHLGSLPRSEAVKLLAPELGDARAAQLHHVAAVRSNLLNQLLIEARKRQGAAGGAGLRAMTLTTPLLSSTLESGCDCEECRTAVSPNAYLADLVRYVYARLRLDTGSGPQPMTVENLDSLFFQPFSQLPEECAAMKDPVLLCRIAVEVLRAYAAVNPLTDPGDITDLSAAQAAYRAQAYTALLAELGTSTTDLRLALGDDDRLTELADLLGLPSKTQVEQLLLTTSELANEDVMESRFGLRKSTRLPLTSPTSPAEILSWKRSRLYSAWRTQDKLVTFPSGVPILDPDVVHSSNLRLYYSSTHDTTTLWNARRTDINTQLTNIEKSRALAVGAGVITVSQPTLGRAATDDESWAAYLVVNLSDDEVQSKAATLPLAQQDQARQKAAEQKVLNAKLARGAVAGSSLSADEQATINALLSYTGTQVAAKAQTESVTWLKLRFEGLTPTSGSALNEGAWADRYTVLKGTYTGTTLTLDGVLQDLVRFQLAQDAFLRAWDLKLKLEGQGYRAMAAADWSELDAIFIARWKKGQVATWLSEEQTKNIKVTADLFWKSPDQPPQPKWLGNIDTYNAFLRALEASITEPIIDPSLITTGAIRDTGSTSVVMTRYSERQQWLVNAESALTTRKGQVEAAAAGSKLAEFDDKLLAFALLIPNQDSTAKAWYEPGSLQKAYEQGNLPIARLDQLLLFRTDFDQLFRVRTLIKGGKTVSDQDWEAALKGLFLAMIRRKYGTWRMEESSDNISLSPEFFLLPPEPTLAFPPVPSVDDAPATRLRTQAELLAWRRILSDRLTQDSTIETAHADLLDRVEQATLPGLRDALIGLYTPSYSTAETPAEWWTDRMLMDFSAAAGTKVSRVSHATNTLQQLFFGLRSGEVFQLKTASNAANYPALSIDGDHFDDEWRWLGSYGSWRSALFIFLYPENLLYPTLRTASERSAVFNELVQEARDGGVFTPARAQRLADRYEQYLRDLNQLVTVSACTVPLQGEDGSEQPTFLIFGLANGRLYYCRREALLDTQGKQGPWQPVRSWPQVETVYGSVPYTTANGESLVCLIAAALDDKKVSKLQVLNLKLSLIGTELWEDGPYDLADLPKSQYVKEPSVTIAVEKTPPTLFASPPHVYIGVQDEFLKTTLTGTALVPGMWVYRNRPPDPIFHPAPSLSRLPPRRCS